MYPRNDSSDIICRSKLKRNFIGSAKRGGTDGGTEGRRDGGTEGRTGLILRSVDLHTTTTTSCFCFKNHVWVVFMYGTYHYKCIGNVYLVGP